MSLHDKHRERLDKKVRKDGLEALEPHEQLEHILYTAIPRGDTNDTAHRLLKKYKTIAAVLNADPEELEDIQGVGPRCAMFLTTLPSVLGIVERSLNFDEPIMLDTIEKIVGFAKTYFYGKLTEEAYLLCLNSTYRLISINRISRGAHDETYIYPAQVVRRAIRDKACSAVMVHNHPCGEVKPSMGDVTLSRDLARGFAAVDIIFADSVIITDKEFFSMREMGYLDNLDEIYNRYSKL